MRWNVENNEMELVHQACRGDREAYWRLVQPHLRAVLSIARTILMNSAEAEEVAQEAVLRARSNIQGFRGQVKFSTWLIQITINEARNRLRQDRRQERSQALDERQTDNGDEYVPKDFTDWREIPSAALERKGVRDALQQALASLPQNCREVFTLRDIAHLSIEETAQVLGLTLRNVKTRLLKARLQMRDALAPGFDGSWSKGKAEHQRAGA
jgi:RNA polymerase sigma-70 factor, ECF subfamily